VRRASERHRQALARHLAYLESDLSDPALRAALVAQARATRGAVAELLAEAVARSELHADTDVPRLARTLELVLTGGVLSVAIEADGAGPCLVPGPGGRGAGASHRRAAHAAGPRCGGPRCMSLPGHG
jgi:hypothetical protein